MSWKINLKSKMIPTNDLKYSKAIHNRDFPSAFNWPYLRFKPRLLLFCLSRGLEFFKKKFCVGMECMY